MIDLTSVLEEAQQAHAAASLDAERALDEVNAANTARADLLASARDGEAVTGQKLTNSASRIEVAELAHAGAVERLSHSEHRLREATAAYHAERLAEQAADTFTLQRGEVEEKLEAGVRELVRSVAGAYLEASAAKSNGHVQTVATCKRLGLTVGKADPSLPLIIDEHGRLTLDGVPVTRHNHERQAKALLEVLANAAREEMGLIK